MLRWALTLSLVLVASQVAAADVPQWISWLGRYHFVLLHLPIGLVIAVCLVEAAAIIANTSERPHSRGLLLWANALATTATVICGWFLAWDASDYQAELLTWHRWGGVAVGCLSWTLLILHRMQAQRPKLAPLLRLHLVILVVAVTLVGHHGGSLTHGQGFLTRHAPTWLGGPAPTPPAADIPVLAPGDDAPEPQPIADPPANTPDFARDIAPILQDRCVECHGPAKQKASLRLDTPTGIRSGGNSGPAVVAGHPERSKLLTMVTLPPDDDDIMPPKGDPLSKAQTDLIRAWILAGADFGDGVEAADAPQAKTPHRPTAFEERAAQLPQPDQAAVSRLQELGVVVRNLETSGRTLEVNASHTTVNEAVFDQLRRLGPHVLWLDLGDTAIDDDALKHLKPLGNLEKLDLGNTAISDAGLIHLLELKELRYLTLVRTQVSDAGLFRLSNLTKLERVYLWGSKATAQGGERLTAKIPACVVNTGP